MSMNLKTWLNVVTPQVRNVVRSVFIAKPECYGLTSQQIFNAAAELFPEKGAPPAPPVPIPEPPKRGPSKRRPIPTLPPQGHPLRSMRYLKKYVLEDMTSRKEVHKVLITRGNGQDEHGDRLDFVKFPSRPRFPAVTRIAEKEAWLWRLRSPASDKDTILESHVDLNPVRYESVILEDESQEDQPLLEPDWEQKLKFKDVKQFDGGRTRVRRPLSFGHKGFVEKVDEQKERFTPKFDWTK